ncbi:GNAT family N-acetyltransferase [Celeribacter persicus]|uniref:N-acetylglutamate synthase-like GNAT family acetyltransferase n=1 Tax=Celeribacter persicus TaxID=1651082 RepID=A0A2T5HUR0_9RHOB|nr:GNAT family N-acetyltransferase [Celeribacter persicus]PTQ75208.1 N-acetylglutamate synthase-like GNAT family acetyltransferase [Celeribacter persicus]
MTLMQPIQAKTQATNPLHIRPARWSDKDALLEMVHALAHHHGDDPELDLTALIDLLNADLPWIRILVAERDSALLGYAALVAGVQLQHGKKVMDLHHLFIRDHARGEGVGRRLIEASRNLAESLGCVRLTVSTQDHNTRAQAVYRACGFASHPFSGARFAMELA